MEPTIHDIQELRSKFLEKLEEEGGGSDTGPFHPADMARVKNGDDWLRRFLLHHDNDQKEALHMLWETCEWRKSFGANDINEKNVNMAILEGGSVFSHGRDKDGKSLLIFKSKKHVKGTYDFDELKRCVVYWFERLERLTKGDKITLYFDMDGSGLSNVDMEFIKYLISLFKFYYPFFLNYILVFEMAWILNAAFKVIKTWLPAKAVQKIKFLNKNTIKEYVPPDEALKSWGGNNEYVFKFVPEQRQSITIPVANEKVDDSRKKVHFADDGSPIIESPTSGLLDTNTSNNRLLITPSDVITFVANGNEHVGSVTLTNSESHTLTYKIKTTSPEKFRVRPNTGFLMPGTVVTINVVLQPGYQIPSLTRDKFLVMSLPVEKYDMSNQELSELWKTQQASGKVVEQHRLRCALGQTPASDSSMRNGSAYGAAVTDDQQLIKISNEVGKLQNHVNKIREDMKSLQKLILILICTILLLTGVIIYMLRAERTIPESSYSAQTCFVPPDQ